MGKGHKVPDAWDDDDWEVQADIAAKQDQDRPKDREEEPQVPMTRAERLAKHAEEQRKLWESAYAPVDRSACRPLSNRHAERNPLNYPFCLPQPTKYP
jgi:hypothetical protein